MAHTARTLMGALIASGTGVRALRIIKEHLEGGGADTGDAAITALTAALGASHATLAKAAALHAGTSSPTDFHLGAGDQNPGCTGTRDTQQLMPDIHAFLYG
jgi:hypothetical protein